jgi:hypothetical protein
MMRPKLYHVCILYLLRIHAGFLFLADLFLLRQANVPDTAGTEPGQWVSHSGFWQNVAFFTMNDGRDIPLYPKVTIHIRTRIHSVVNVI